jgi:predicted transcriptional regulator
VTNRTVAAQQYLSVSQSEIRDAIEAMGFAAKRELLQDWEAKRINGHTHLSFRDYAVSVMEQRILHAADAANRSYY